jgi:hypothetical protein
MLREGFPLEELDDGVRRLVYALNRIPQVGTMTTCEGHVWRDTPFWPTKDGWVYFAKPEGVHEGLVTEIQDYCTKNEFFKMGKPYKISPRSPNYIRVINGRFEDHDSGALFDRINEEEQEKYFKRAEIRKEQLLKGWYELGGIVERYIIRNITKDIESLPYI